MRYADRFHQHFAAVTCCAAIAFDVNIRIVIIVIVNIIVNY